MPEQRPVSVTEAGHCCLEVVKNLVRDRCLRFRLLAITRGRIRNKNVEAMGREASEKGIEQRFVGQHRIDRISASYECGNVGQGCEPDVRTTSTPAPVLIRDNSPVDAFIRRIPACETGSKSFPGDERKSPDVLAASDEIIRLPSSFHRSP